MSKKKRYPISGFPERLTESIKSGGLNKGKLAEKLCVDRKTVYAWCDGYTEPPISILGKICKTLDVSADYLLFGAKDG